MSYIDWSAAYIKRAVTYFPPGIGDRLEAYIAGMSGIVNEIRAKAESQITVRTNDRTVCTGIEFSGADMRLLLRALCGNSLYSHSESLKEGFITTSDGIRAGIAGRAVTENGRIVSVADITTVNIRIPSRYPGAAGELAELLEGFGFRDGVLIYSPPSGGKTTLLRELTDVLSNRPNPVKIAVVDSRCEICSGLGEGCYDALLGYPRAKGMEIALRTLSPQMIICDEINTEDDVCAITEACGAGVPIVASVHGSHSDVLKRPIVQKLVSAGAFRALYGIEKKGITMSGKVTWTRDIK